MSLDELLQWNVGWIFPGSCIPLMQDALVFGLGEDRELRDRTIRVRKCAHEEGLIMTEQALNCARIEEPGVIIRGHQESGGLLLKVQHQLQASGARFHLIRRNAEPGEVHGFPSRLLPDQCDLKWMKGGAEAIRLVSLKSGLE